MVVFLACDLSDLERSKSNLVGYRESVMTWYKVNGFTLRDFLILSGIEVQW